MVARSFSSEFKERVVFKVIWKAPTAALAKSYILPPGVPLPENNQFKI